MPRLTVIIISLIIFLGFNQALAEETLLDANNNDNKQSCQLTFGFTEWKPLQYLNKSGIPTGIQIDLVKKILKEMDCQLKFNFGTWAENLEQIKLGEVDFTANASKTIERQTWGLFSTPYRKDEFTVYVKQEDKEKFKFNSIEALKKSGFKLGLTQNYMHGSEIEAWQNESQYKNQLTYVEFADQNFERLFNNEIDGLLEDPLVVSYRLRAKDFERRVIALPIRTFGRDVSFIFSKKNFDQAFIEKFNQALNKVTNDPSNRSIWIANKPQLPAKIN